MGVLDTIAPVLGGLFGGAAEGWSSIPERTKAIASTAGQLAALRRSVMDDLASARNLEDLRGRMSAYTGAGFQLTEETKGRSIVATTQNELMTQALAEAARTEDLDQSTGKLREGLGYAVQRGLLSPEQTTSLLMHLSGAELQNRARQLELEQTAIVRQELQQLSQEAQGITATYGDKALSSQLIVDAFAERAQQFGVPLSDAVKSSLAKVPASTLQTVLSKLTTEHDFTQLEQALTSQDGSAILRTLAQYTTAPRDTGSPAPPQEPPDPIEAMYQRRVKAAHAIAFKQLNAESLSRWLKEEEALQEYRQRKAYTKLLEPAIKKGLARYGETDPTGTPWYPQAKSVMGMVTTLQAMGELLPTLEADPSPVAQEKAKQMRDAMASLNATIKASLPVTLTPQTIRAIESLFPEHFSAADPVHVAQVLASPTMSQFILKQAEQLDIETEARKEYLKTAAREKASAEYSPNEFQRDVAMATGLPLGTPMTPEMVKAGLDFYTKRWLNEIKQRTEVELQTKQGIVTTVEEAAKLSLLFTGLSALDEIEPKVIDPKTGAINRKNLALMAIDAPGSNGRLILTALYQAIWAQARPQTGAAVATVEREDFINMYGPKLTDNDATVKYKLQSLRDLIMGTFDIRDPDGKLRKILASSPKMSFNDRLKYIERLMTEMKDEEATHKKEKKK